MNSGITINGNYFSAEDIKQYCVKFPETKPENWEKSIYSFISEWYDEKDYFLVNTSGSTGKPKPIKINKKHALASAKATIKYFDLKEGNVAWLCLPADYIAGKMMIVRAISSKLNLVYSKPQSCPEINVEKIDFCAMVVNQAFELISHPEKVKTLQKINKLLIGGSAMPKSLEQKLLQNNKINAWQSFGMTETITHVGLRKIRSNNSFYDPLPGVKFSVNHNNNLIINAPNIGISNLITNDIVETDEKGRIKIKGRSDNIIVSGGKKFQPEEIENKLSDIITFPFFIGSLPDEKLGSKITLFIEDKNGDSEIEKLKEKIRVKLHKHEIPKEIVYLHKFTRTNTDKIRRNETIHLYTSSK